MLIKGRFYLKAHNEPTQIPNFYNFGGGVRVATLSNLCTILINNNKNTITYILKYNIIIRKYANKADYISFVLISMGIINLALTLHQCLNA